MSTYRQKFIRALSLARTLDDFEYLKEKLETTDKINRRTLQGRTLSNELFGLWLIAYKEFSKNNQPFT